LAKRKPLIDADGEVGDLTSEEVRRSVPFSALSEAEQKMLRSLHIARKTSRWDPAEYLTTPGRIAAYLEAAFDDGDPSLIATALGDIARARGMTQLAAEAGVTREALYKALSPAVNPRLSTLLGVMKALGIKLKPRAA
jgi:probable addiction module antidote protein